MKTPLRTLLLLLLTTGCASGGYSPSYIISDSIDEDPIKIESQEAKQAR